MRYQTKLIKDILKKHFPDKKYSIRYLQARQYYDTSDKIRIKIDADDYNHMCTILNAYTRDIKVCMSTHSVAMSGITYPKIYNIHTEQFEDADMLEFIELETKEKGRGR